MADLVKRSSLPLLKASNEEWQPPDTPAFAAHVILVSSLGPHLLVVVTPLGIPIFISRAKCEVPITDYSHGIQ